MRPWDPTYFCQSSPLIFTCFLVTICMWCLLMYLFLLCYPEFRSLNKTVGSDTAFSLILQNPTSRFHWYRWIRFNDISISAESFTYIFMLDPVVFLCWIQWSRCNLRIRTFQTIISNISANSNSNQGTKRDCLMKKNEGRKSRDMFLKRRGRNSQIRVIQTIWQPLKT
jgi:hypothetical protein